MTVRGIRGAIVAAADTPEAIYTATIALLQAIQSANPSLKPEDIGSVIFTVTSDLNSAYPARAARDIGWRYVPLPKNQDQIHHIYMGAAAKLRPDIAKEVSK